VQSLAGVLGKAMGDELEDLRCRLQSAIRQLVSEIWMLVVRLGDNRQSPRVAAVQVRFHKGTAPRSILVHHGSGMRNNYTVDPGDPGTGHIDLRRRKDALALENVLADWDLDNLA
jgi:hypothetical protein